MVRPPACSRSVVALAGRVPADRILAGVVAVAHGDVDGFPPLSGAEADVGVEIEHGVEFVLDVLGDGADQVARRDGGVLVGVVAGATGLPLAALDSLLVAPVLP